MTWRKSLQVLPSVIDSVHFTPEDVYQELCLLDPKKACGPDQLPPFLLKEAAEFISSPLSKLFNQSMSTGTLPCDWTTPNVVPVFKKGDKKVPSNYRPISLTSIVVKVIERIIRYKLTSVLEKSGRLSDNQFSFCNKWSTVSLLLSAVHDWCKCLEDRSSVHWTLLMHLTLYLMRGYCLSWKPWAYLVRFLSGFALSWHVVFKVLHTRFTFFMVASQFWCSTGFSFRLITFVVV